MLWLTSTKGTEIRKMQLTLKRRTLSFLSTEKNFHYGKEFPLPLQRGNGNYKDSEDSLSSQATDSSQSSQETDSSQEHLNPWSCILDEAHDEVQLSALVDKYKRNGDSENAAHLEAQNALLPLYRKELRKVLLEYLQGM